MARHCVRWASGKKSKAGAKRHRQAGKKHCRFGVVRKGRRKGQCLKNRRAKKHKRVNTAKRGRYIFHG